MKWVVALLALTAGCATYSSTARSAFVHQATCPADRVVVTHPAPEPPPPEIAADPGRAAVWNEEAQKRADSELVATGCGQTQRYTCQTLYAGEGKYQTSYPSCTPIM